MTTMLEYIGYYRDETTGEIVHEFLMPLEKEFNLYITMDEYGILRFYLKSGYFYLLLGKYDLSLKDFIKEKPLLYVHSVPEDMQLPNLYYVCDFELAVKLLNDLYRFYLSLDIDTLREECTSMVSTILELLKKEAEKHTLIPFKEFLEK